VSLLNPPTWSDWLALWWPLLLLVVSKLVVMRTIREPKGPPFAGPPLLLEAEVPGPE